MAAATITKQPPIIIAFREWTTQQLEKKFQLHRIKNCETLEAWLKKPGQMLSKENKQAIEVLRDKLDTYALYWNEDELKWYFISRFFNLIDLESPYFHLFVNRRIKAKVGKYELNGRVDALIASGNYEPEVPFYCFHEYKKEKGSADDPVGQLLSAMLAGRKLNQDDEPIYGTYLIGRLWFFVTLEKDHYCISKAYVASNDDIFDIYRIVSSLKGIIEKRLGV